MTDLVYRRDLSDTLQEFLTFVGSRVHAYGETWALALNKTQMANAYGKSVRTIQRYVNELEDMNYLTTATKVGKGGGTVIVFNKAMMDFEPQVNPVTEETLTTEELLEKLYPNKPKKQPKRKYRPKALIAEERIRRQKRQGEIEQLNDLLEETGYPTTEFWKQTPQPERYYKAWLITRMYNFYAVYYPEKMKNESEADNNRFRYELAEMYQNRLTDFDVLPTRFLGTSNFTVALNMVDVLDDVGVNPGAYLTVQFNFMQYLINQGKNVNLPYFNTLLSEKSAKRWDDTYAYRVGFRKEHPYHATSPDEVVEVEGYKVPHMNMLIAEYKKPFTRSGHKEFIDMFVDPITSPKRVKVINAYFQAITDEIKKDETLGENEAEVLTEWVTQQTAIHIASRYPDHAYLITALDQLTDKIVSFEGDNKRKLYHDLGNYSLDTAVDQIEIKVRTKTGYFQNFSIAGSNTFYRTMQALRNSRGVELDKALLAEAITKFGKRKIPITKHGDLDVQQIALKHMTENELEEESYSNASQITDEQKYLDFFEGMWYDIKEDYVAQSIRDGRMVIK